MAPGAPPRPPSNRRGIMVAAFSAIIIVGTLTGAQLKQDKQKEETIKKFRKTTPDEQIALLEDRKEALLKDRVALQRKMDDFHERVQRQEEEAKTRQQ